MTFKVHQTRRDRVRKLADGQTVTYCRHWLDYRDPATGRRRLLAFKSEEEATAARLALETSVTKGLQPGGHQLTVADVMERWLEDRRPHVRKQTLQSYKDTSRNVVGPVILCTPDQRREFTRRGEKPQGARYLPALGHRRLSELSPAVIREWHNSILEHVGHHTAQRSLMFLKAALILAQEDYGITMPVIPRNLNRGRRKMPKAVLSPPEIARLLDAAERDMERGVYYAFGFLAGTRPSEQLGLLWQEVDFERNVIRIRRVQGRDGSLIDMTKTQAGIRDIPMGPRLRRMLLAWKLRCPRGERELYRVFPGLGRPRAWPLPREAGGGPLLYRNFLRRFWTNPLKRLGLPAVTPHSARHAYISTLQAQGIEIALVAKVVGHANPGITAGIYSHAMRGTDAAAQAIERAFENRSNSPPNR